MSYLPALFGTVAAYILLAVLLLSLNIASLWRWWVKLGAIVLTTAAFIWTYLAITGLIGWPSPQAIPGRFSLISTRIVEPDKASGAPGHLYLWVETVDEENLPISQPRNHEIAYTDEMAEALYAAQQKLNDGQEILGEMLDDEQASDEEQRADAEEGTGDEQENGQEGDNNEETKVGGGSNAGAQERGDGYLMDVTNSLRLSDMPPPELPTKD